MWVVRRTRMRVSRFPRFGERHRLMTFCSGLGKMWAERRTSIVLADTGQSDVEAVSLWVHLDPASRRPTPFNEQEIATYGDAADGRRVTARLRHPTPDALEPRSAWRFRATEADVADHINNAAFWQPLEEELLSDGEIDSLDVEIEFRSPAQPGEKLYRPERPPPLDRRPERRAARIDRPRLSSCQDLTIVKLSLAEVA